MQKGRIYLASGVFYVQYRATIVADGVPKRVQVSHRLCMKDDLYYSESCKAVKLLRDEFMLTVNKSPSLDSPQVRIVDFWEDFMRHCSEIRPVDGRARKKPVTIRGYKQVWKQHLAGHFGNLRLNQYEPRMGNALLQSLTATHRKATLKHIKAVASSLFNYAVQKELTTVNPWRAVQIPIDAVDGEETLHYTLHEAENMISALVDRVDCQLVIALACFFGLRPGEIEAARWEDFDDYEMHIRRNCVRGIVGTPKTTASMDSLPLIDPIRVPLELWRRKSGNPTEGWLFPTVGTLTAERISDPQYAYLVGGPSPQSILNMLVRVIRPTLKAQGIPWKRGGLYCGRRGAGTAIIEQSHGDIALGQRLLRHDDAATTTRFYKKQISDARLREGMNLLER